MRRSTGILLTVWSLLVLPALCVAGVLHHPCVSDGPEDCGHEEDCPEDPCGEPAVARGQPKEWLAVESVGLAWATPAQTPTSLLTPQEVSSDVEEDGATRQRLQLPFPPSDVPLLI